jgi:hypothetical protein
MAATSSATLIGSASATRKVSLAARSEASATEIAATKLSSASSDRRLSKPANGSGIGVLASVASDAILPFTPLP